MVIEYSDSFVARLADDIEALIANPSPSQLDSDGVLARLLELAQRNCPAYAQYCRRYGTSVGVPDRAFKSHAPYLFSNVEPVLTFETSGTSAAFKGRAHYTALGERLLRATIVAGAKRCIFTDLERPAVVRLVPTPQAAPAMVMAYGMQLIEQRFGDPHASGSVIGPHGIELPALEQLLDRAVAAAQPVVLIGGSFGFVNLCERLRTLGRRWELPVGSRMVDAGGFKGRSRSMSVAELRALVADTLGIAPARCNNIFGMTELASQLYDAEDRPLGPNGERPKLALPHVWARARNPADMSLLELGTGMLEVVDLCNLDRPCVLLTGDLARSDGAGIALAGRISSGGSRGCSLTLDALTAQGAPRAHG